MNNNTTKEIRTWDTDDDGKGRTRHQNDCLRDLG